MAKNKNPLKDLDAFLKQQASSLVKPDEIKKEEKPLAEKPTSTPEPVVEEPKEETKVYEATEQVQQKNWDDLLLDFIKSSEDFRPELYQTLIEGLEQAKIPAAHDKLLINTLLYLKNPDDWKKNIEEYWSK